MTLEIGADSLADHLEHGDTEGECPDEATEESDEGETAGETEGETQTLEVREGKVAVCHLPNGDEDKARTIVVGDDALESHLEHGDTEGECAEEGARPQGPPPHAGQEVTEAKEGQVLVCHRDRTRSVSADALAAHLAHGDTEGACA